jgi:hypothetical protein
MNNVLTGGELGSGGHCLAVETGSGSGDGSTGGELGSGGHCLAVETVQLVESLVAGGTA